MSMGRLKLMAPRIWLILIWALPASLSWNENILFVFHSPKIALPSQ